MKKFLKLLDNPLILLIGYTVLASLHFLFAKPTGLWGTFWKENTALKLIIYISAMTHITISCMSLSFHRHHTHKGVIFNKYFDGLMQTWLWLVTSMSKLDWVSVHQYHHIHSDTEKDPHSPVIKGLAHVLFLGVPDYTKAKNDPEVLKLRYKIHANKYEQFISENLFFGPSINVAINILFFGLAWGTTLSIINFLISPIFAVGGVNAIAHWWGYRNHQSKDNSRNIGFIFPLNFLICGELDHNNHHAHQRSCSFRHKWYEFDIGYLYIKLLKTFHLASIKSVYTPKTLKHDMAKRAKKLMEYDFQFKNRCATLSVELNKNYNELSELVCAYIEGKKVRLERPLMNFAHDLKLYLEWQNKTQAFA